LSRRRIVSNASRKAARLLRLSQSIGVKAKAAQLQGKSGKLPFRIWYFSRCARGLKPAQSARVSAPLFSCLHGGWRR
jgi:hypothetical protein